MSSIAAVFFRSAPADARVVVRMLRAAPHRGSNLQTSSIGSVVLGVSSVDDRELAVTGVAHGLAIALRGRLDNVAELGQRFGNRSTHRFSIETLTRGFDTLGPSLFPLLRGAFSLAVSDGRRLWIVRDQAGFRPLVMCANPSGVFVGSEVKQVVAGTELPLLPDLQVLEQTYFSRTGDDTRTAIRGVSHVRHAHFLVADDGKERMIRYWDPESLLETGPRYSPSELQEQFDHLMTQATSRSLIGKDVVSLSGGVDSPALAAYAAPVFRERYGTPLAALSTVYPNDPSVDEKPYIEAAAAEFGLDLHMYESKARPTDGLARWVRLLDGPVPVVSLAETEEHLLKARSLGFRNMLTGSFAEYVFDARDDLLEYLFARGRIRAAILQASVRRSQGTPFRRLARTAARSIVPARLLQAWRGLRGVHRRVPGPAWVDPAHLASFPPLSGRQIWRQNQIAALKGPTPSLDANDLIQCLTGVGVARPFADIDLWEFFLQLPADLKYPPDSISKSLVRGLLRDRVPDLILDRRKKTFFDEAIMKRVDYECLERWIGNSEFRLPGIAYDLLLDKIRGRNLSLLDFMWAKNLAGVHAFVSQV